MAAPRVSEKTAVMLAVADAQQMVLRFTAPLAPRHVAPTEAALGLVLAEDVASDLDVPPYDKALMDGYAVRSSDLASGKGVLSVVEEILAGQTPRQPVAAGQASRIMTGAPMPAGANAVVQVERTKLLQDGRVSVEAGPLKAGQNVLVQGREMRRGETVVSAGTVLRPTEIGLLATIGRAAVDVVPRPRVAVLPTGDELVGAAATPGPGQIRNSNGPMLVAQTLRAGGLPQPLGIGRDSLESLRPLVEEGLKCDVLVLSGGVSAGKRDLVPDVLHEAGVVPHFHKIDLKPGKPVFFGTRDKTLVFGLPGNPVSSLVAFELFVRPALRRLRGHADPGPRVVDAALDADYAYNTDRPTYHPAFLTMTANGYRVRVVPWFGSPDLRGLLRANALVVLPPGDLLHKAGQVYSALPFEDPE
jgi:molybdopterin molybdotransferase